MRDQTGEVADVFAFVTVWAAVHLDDQPSGGRGCGTR